MNNVIIRDFVDVGGLPNIGAVFGTPGAQSVIRQVEDRFGGGSTVFGSDNDPYRDLYHRFATTIVRPSIDAVQFINSAIKLIDTPADPVPMFTLVDNIADIGNITESMKVHILTHPTVRDFLVNDRIYGFGIDHRSLPEEDTMGRLLKNGTATKGDEHMIFEYHKGDPDLDLEDLDTIERTRSFYSAWLLAHAADGVDPTDLLGGSIGGLK